MYDKLSRGEGLSSSDLEVNQMGQISISDLQGQLGQLKKFRFEITLLTQPTYKKHTKMPQRRTCRSPDVGFLTISSQKSTDSTVRTIDLSNQVFEMQPSKDYKVERMNQFNRIVEMSKEFNDSKVVFGGDFNMRDAELKLVNDGNYFAANIRDCWVTDGQNSDSKFCQSSHLPIHVCCPPPVAVVMYFTIAPA